ncbi:unnamed protein product, partial [Prorocentrum cordatum]
GVDRLQSSFAMFQLVRWTPTHETSLATFQKASKGISKNIVTKVGCALDKSDHRHGLMDNAMLMGQFIDDHGDKISQMEKELSQFQCGHDGATDALTCMMAQLGKWSQIAPFPTCLDGVSDKLGVAVRGRVKAALGNSATTSVQFNNAQKMIGEASLVWPSNGDYVVLQEGVALRIRGISSSEKVAEVTASIDAIINVPFVKDLSAEDAVAGATAEGGISVSKPSIVKLTASVEGLGAVSEVPDELKQKMSGFKPFLLALPEATIGGDGFNEVQVCVDKVSTSRAFDQVVNWAKVNQLHQALHSVILKHGAFVQTGADGNDPDTTTLAVFDAMLALGRARLALDRASKGLPKNAVSDKIFKVAHAHVNDMQILAQKGHEYRIQSFTYKINERLRIFGPTSKGGDGAAGGKAAELLPLKKMSAHAATYKQLEKEKVTLLDACKAAGNMHASDLPIFETIDTTLHHAKACKCEALLLTAMRTEKDQTQLPKKIRAELLELRQWLNPLQKKWEEEIWDELAPHVAQIIEGP